MVLSTLSWDIARAVSRLRRRLSVCHLCGVPVAPDLLLPFLLASLLVTVIPGPDLALVTRQVLVGGTPLAHRTIAGNLTGLLVHGFALAAGLSALLVASATAYTTVKLAGAVYLVWLGIQAIRASRRPPELDLAATGAASRHAYLQGLLSTVLNPKPALFFLTFLPQFVDRDAAVLPQTLTLAAIHVVVGLVILTAYAHLVDRARAVLTAPRLRAWLERSTGAVLIALGVRVAVERR
jgi:threonine/homoserine/homoserine lactone efflux protein